MKEFIKYICVIFILIGCSSEKCPEGINLLPMYGKVEKCKKQKESDERFIEECLRNFETKEQACVYHVNKGWELLAENEVSTAMKRFNQAWLLDSLNSDVYCGFGTILRLEGKLDEAFKYFDKSLDINPQNVSTLQSSALTYGWLFQKRAEKNDINIEYMNEMIARLRKAASIEPQNAKTYALLTQAYCFFNQKDSAKKYLAITDKLDSSLIEDHIRDLITRLN